MGVEEGNDGGPEIEGDHYSSTVSDDGGKQVRWHVPTARLLKHLQCDLEDPRQLHGHVPVVHRIGGIGFHVRVEPLLQPEVHLVLRPYSRNSIRYIEVEVARLRGIRCDHIVVDVVTIVHGIAEELPSAHRQIGDPVVEPFRLGHLVGQYQGDEGARVGAALLELTEPGLAKVTRKPPDVQVVDLLVNGHGAGAGVVDPFACACGSAAAPRTPQDVRCPASLQSPADPAAPAAQW